MLLFPTPTRTTNQNPPCRPSFSIIPSSKWDSSFCCPTFSFKYSITSLYNDPKLSERLVRAFRKTLGAERVHEVDAVMGGEDFSRYGRAGVPIFMYRLGVVAQSRLDAYAAKGEKPPSVHSPEKRPP